MSRGSLISVVLVGVALLQACDSGISGTAFDNQPPETALSVRDESLLDNLVDDERLVSTVRVTWSGDDPDGFVKAYEVRFFDLLTDSGENEPWTLTQTTDSLFLLPIRAGERTSDVVFEVRAIDDQDLRDPTPARTIFPIKNSPPEIRLNIFDLPPDTTFNVMSLAWSADDPDGRENLARIDVSFNDSMNFVGLPPDTEFATFVVPDADPGAIPATAEARVFVGRGFESTSIRVPGIRLNDDNTFYIRSVDQTDTTSVRTEYTWYVKAKTADVLYVNDFRRATQTTASIFHLNLLRNYLPGGTPVDTWDISTPFTTGSAGSFPRSDQLPAAAQPGLEQFFVGYRYIYWVSTGTTDMSLGNNLPFAASVMAPFFEQGGKMMVYSPVGLPVDPESITSDAATLLLPLSDLITFPDSLRQTLRLLTNTPVSTSVTLPSTSVPMPQLKMSAFVLNTLPYAASGANIIPIYQADFQYITRVGNRRGIWPGASTVASLSADQRVGFFTLPLVNELTGVPTVVGANGDAGEARLALELILESLGFPKR